MRARPTPRGLLLNLLLAKGELSSREAVAACALFDIRDNSARVALTRLSGERLVVASSRGAYRLGPAAGALSAEVSGWRTAERRARPWDGGYVGVHTGALPRSDRAALRSRLRALQLVGLRELSRGLFVRPDNLEGGAEGVRARLYALGLEAGAPVFTVHGLDPARDRAARALWDGAALSRSYAASREALLRWLARADRLPVDAAAREAYLLGDRAIRQIVFDPLLPRPLVDLAARRAFFAAVRRFDRAGHALFRRFFDTIAHGRVRR